MQRQALGVATKTRFCGLSENSTALNCCVCELAIATCTEIKELYMPHLLYSKR